MILYAVSSHDLISFSFHDAKLVLWTSSFHEHGLLVVLDTLLLPRIPWTVCHYKGASKFRHQLINTCSCCFYLFAVLVCFS